MIKKKQKIEIEIWPLLSSVSSSQRLSFTPLFLPFAHFLARVPKKKEHTIIKEGEEW